jgi:hypothetical protein
MSLLLAALTLCAGGSTAQDGHRVYPVYEGWTPNEDGTATLVFGYFNESPEPVEIPVGPGNAFSPGAADRGQPTLFRTGRQRSVCVMVVSGDFADNLRWTLEWNGLSTGTTEKGGLDQLYLLESIGGAVRLAREIDTASAPRGVCLNRAPLVRAGADQKQTARSVELQGFVFDEGLPRGSTLAVTWRQVSGPGAASFAAPNEPRTRVDFDVSGAYELELAATDGAAVATDRVTVEVGPDLPR